MKTIDVNKEVLKELDGLHHKYTYYFDIAFEKENKDLPEISLQLGRLQGLRDALQVLYNHGFR